MNDKVIKVGLMGLGTVGTGVYKVMENQKSEFPYKIGTQMEITKILVREDVMEDARSRVRNDIQVVGSYEEIVNDPEIEIVVEVMGGIDFAKKCILACLNAGKSVVTANKDLVAVHGRELLDAAAANGCDFLFEASVAGAIPIIRPLKQCLAANNISEVMGIVNGTTNYILTKMTLEGMTFEEALAKATELGYAEADPTADIEGLDAARKVAIMGSIAFNSRVVLDDVYVEGITKLTAEDISYATEMGYTIKLLGVARHAEGDGIEVRVHPMLIPSSHPLATVNDSFNAVFVHGDAVDDVMFYGRGAGELPTASAVVGDVMDIARNMMYNCKGRIHCSCYKEIPIKAIDDCKSSYFIRMQAMNRPGVLAAISGVFGENNVSIAQFIQKNAMDEEAEMVLITEHVLEKDFRKAVDALREMPILKEISAIIRVYSA